MTPVKPTVDLIVPTLNEAHVLEQSVEAIRAYLTANFSYPWIVTVADNGSKDGTDEIAKRLAAKYDDVRCVLLDKRGRGRALRLAWSQSPADIMAYTDVDISTDLKALEPMVRGLHEEGYDVATGSRLMRESEVTRGPKREFISRCYNLLVKAALFTRFSDAQCGFKAVTRRVVEEVVPRVKDQGWFFDTELLVLAEKLGFRIKDVPARWIDDDDSRVKIVSTAWEDIKGVARVRRHLWTRDFKDERARIAKLLAAGESPTPSKPVAGRS